MKHTKHSYENLWDKGQTVRQRIVDCAFRGENLSSILWRVRKKYRDFPDLTEKDIEGWLNSTEV